MKSFAAALALFGTVFGTPSFDTEFTQDDLTRLSDSDYKTMFAQWKSTFSKTYKDLADEATHYSTWMSNLEYIAESNSAGHSWTLRLNQFGDLTGDEFKIAVHGHTGSCIPSDDKTRRLSQKDAPIDQDPIIVNEDGDNPASVDWEAAGDVTPVKNQGQCGSCWAFASTGAIECMYAIKHNVLNSLSEQQLVDCTTSYGNYGCDGGWWYNAFKYVQQEGGLCNEYEYPYTAADGVCKASSCGTKYDAITGYDKITPDSGSALETAVANGCVAVGVEADQSAFQFYSGGILTGTCGTTIDHGVLIVGYGSENNQEYWKVKNSWGTSWGNKGYLYICKDCDKNGVEGECGINMYPYQPTV